MLIEVDAIHLLMRFADSVLQINDTIKEHHEIITKHGAAWIGKLGKPLGPNHVKAVNRQVAAGHTTYLFLVQKVKGDYLFYQGKIVAVAEALPEKDRRLVPSYYRDKKLAFWTKLSSLELVPTRILNNYHIASSSRPVLGTLKRSMAALFVLNEGQAGYPY